MVAQCRSLGQHLPLDPAKVGLQYCHTSDGRASDFPANSSQERREIQRDGLSGLVSDKISHAPYNTIPASDECPDPTLPSLATQPQTKQPTRVRRLWVHRTETPATPSSKPQPHQRQRPKRGSLQPRRSGTKRSVDSSKSKQSRTAAPSRPDEVKAGGMAIVKPEEGTKHSCRVFAI